MTRENLNTPRKTLIKKGFTTFFFVGILYTVISNKTVLSYFLKAETIIQIAFFTVAGGFLYYGVNYFFIKKNKKKDSNA